MKLQHFVGIFVTILLAMFAYSGIQRVRSGLVTVVVKESVDFTGDPVIEIYRPWFSFYKGGSEDQVYLFSGDSTDEDWNLDVVVEGNWYLSGSRDQEEFLLICAPRGLSEEQILRYMWDRYHSQNWHVSWSGYDTPGKVSVWCR